MNILRQISKQKINSKYFCSLNNKKLMNNIENNNIINEFLEINNKLENTNVKNQIVMKEILTVVKNLDEQRKITDHLVNKVDTFSTMLCFSPVLFLCFVMVIA